MLKRKMKWIALLAAIAVAELGMTSTAEAVWLGDGETFDGIEIIDKQYKQKEMIIEGKSYIAQPQFHLDEIYVEGDHQLNFKNTSFDGISFLLKRGAKLKLEGGTCTYHSQGIRVFDGSSLEAYGTALGMSVSVSGTNDDGIAGYALLENCSISGNGNLSVADGGKLEIKGGTVAGIGLGGGQGTVFEVSGLQEASLSSLGIGGQMNIHDCGAITVSDSFDVGGTLTVENTSIEVAHDSFGIKGKIILGRGANLTIHGEALSEGIIELSGGASLDICGGYYTVVDSGAAIILDGVPQDIGYAEELHLVSSQG